ncbi:MAG: dTDP-4-dehydrorhamnose reductase [Alistipes sp.]|nr:dTDP-4-dehydrorhamnose reductase [Alistipes sp.]
MLNILVTGGGGQLSLAIAEAAENAADNYTFLSHAELDICDHKAVESMLRSKEIDVVVNCAAYTNVERAEEDMDVYRINRDAVAGLSTLCKRYKTTLLHISTDYVFGGDTTRNTPYLEDDPTAPINNYGLSKAEGEEAVVANGGIVIRTSWLYSPWGNNFVRTIIGLATTEPTLKVVDDQRGTPTSALTLARMIVGLIERGQILHMSGIYHYTDRGEATWYEFACEIARICDASCTITACSSTDRPTRAKRPAYSVLSKRRICTFDEIILTDWKVALAECITRIKQN